MGGGRLLKKILTFGIMLMFIVFTYLPSVDTTDIEPTGIFGREFFYGVCIYFQKKTIIHSSHSIFGGIMPHQPKGQGKDLYSNG